MIRLSCAKINYLIVTKINNLLKKKQIKKLWLLEELSGGRVTGLLFSQVAITVFDSPVCTSREQVRDHLVVVT